MRPLFRVFVALFVVACVTPTTVTVAVPIKPTGRMVVLYEEAIACAGLEADIELVRWFIVPGVRAWWVEAEGRQYHGLWRSPHDIYIAEHATDLDWVVRHEALHDGLQGGDHPEPPFGRCEVLE